MDHPKRGPKMSCSGSSNVSGENLEEACCGGSNFCQNCIKGFPLRNCNKKGNKSFAKTPQGRRAHLTRELCSATTDIKTEQALASWSFRAAALPLGHRRGHRGTCSRQLLSLPFPRAAQRGSTFWAVGYCLAQARDLQSITPGTW